MEALEVSERGVEGSVACGRSDGYGGNKDGVCAKRPELGGQGRDLVTGAGDEDAFRMGAEHL